MSALKNPLEKLGRALEWHKERHRPTGLGFALADSVRYLDAAVWDELTAGKSFFLRRPYLQALEGAAPDNMRTRYALVFDGKRPAAAVVMQLVEVAGDRVVKPKPASAKALANVRAKALVCGNLLSWGQHGAAFAAGADPAKVWPGVAEALYRVRQAEKLAGQTDLVMVKDLDGGCDGVDALERFSYHPVATDPDMVLTFEPGWRTFDDYLAGLHSKYRKNALKIGKDLAAAGCRLEPLGDWRADAKRIYELYLQVNRAAALKPVTAHPGYQAAVAQAAGADMRCTVVRRGDRLLGFVTTLKDSADTAVGYHIGFERDELPLYFALLQSVVADALALGAKRLSLGRTALEPKAKLGARPNPMRIWVRHANPLANVLVKQLLSVVPHHEAPDRNPFKDVAPAA